MKLGASWRCTCAGPTRAPRSSAPASKSLLHWSVTSVAYYQRFAPSTGPRLLLLPLHRDLDIRILVQRFLDTVRKLDPVDRGSACRGGHAQGDAQAAWSD